MKTNTAPATTDESVAAAARPSVRLVSLSALFVLAVASAGYLWTGSPGGAPAGSVPAGFAEAQAENPAAAASAAAEFNVMVERLAARMKERPDDAVGFAMLGRSYLVLGRYDESVAAYERALKIKPDEASLIVDYAEAVAMKNGRNLEGEPLKLIERALKIDPQQLKGLSLAGAAAFNRGDFAGAAARWDRVVAIGLAEDPLVQNARDSAAEARQAGKLPPAAVAATGTAAAGNVPAAAAADAAVSGTVSLAPALRAAAAPDDTVFIFARAPEGSRMPLAILKKKVSDLPVSFTLDDSMAMSPAATLSGAKAVIVGARVSKSGQAMQQPGDLLGQSAVVAPGVSGLQITIGEESR